MLNARAKVLWLPCLKLSQHAVIATSHTVQATVLVCQPFLWHVVPSLSSPKSVLVQNKTLTYKSPGGSVHALCLRAALISPMPCVAYKPFVNRGSLFLASVGSWQTSRGNQPGQLSSQAEGLRQPFPLRLQQCLLASMLTSQVPQTCI